MTIIVRLLGLVLKCVRRLALGGVIFVIAVCSVLWDILGDDAYVTLYSSKGRRIFHMDSKELHSRKKRDNVA